MSFCKAECLEACIIYACKSRMPPSGRLLEGITLEWLSSCFFRDAQESRICGHVLWRPEISKSCEDEIDDLTEWQWRTNKARHCAGLCAIGLVGTLFLFQRIIRRGVQADAGTDEAAGTVRAQVDGIHASGHQRPNSAGGIVKIIITAFATDFQFDGSGGLFLVQ